MARQKSAVEKVNRTRVTLVGNVDVEAVAKVVASSFPGVEVKTWAKRSKSAKKAKTESNNTVSE